MSSLYIFICLFIHYACAGAGFPSAVRHRRACARAGNLLSLVMQPHYSSFLSGMMDVFPFPCVPDIHITFHSFHTSFVCVCGVLIIYSPAFNGWEKSMRGFI